MTYLETNDSPLKIQERCKLEGFIKEYVCLVPNENKYIFQETSHILLRSAKTLKGFSVYRASEAWSAISIYASNLLCQPWRKEYRCVQTYSGYYKHEIEANLFQPELMFYLMGYKKSEHSMLTIDGPVDPDKVSNVSRDAIVAFVECQILKQIFENVSKSFSISWLDVIEYRKNYVGSAEQAIQSIQHLHLKDYQNQLKSKNYLKYHQNRLNSTTSQSFFLDSYDSSNNEKTYEVIANDKFIQNCASACRSVNYEKQKNDLQVISEAQIEQSTINLTRKIIPKLNNKCEKSCHRNGESSQLDINLIDYHTKHPCVRDKAVVKTSITPNQTTSESSLINLTSENVRSANDRELVTPKKNTARRRNDDSAVTVKRLHHYSPKTQTTFLKTVEKEISCNDEFINKLEFSLDLIDFNKTSRKIEKVKIHQSKDITQLKEKTEKVPVQFIKKHQDIGYDEWNCLFCTFINTAYDEICQMCGKSRKSLINEKSLESGSKQCPNCTLVNQRNASICEVCETNLKNSPTYV